MGAFTSRRNGGVEEVDIAASNAYRYPPKSGKMTLKSCFETAKESDLLQ